MRFLCPAVILFLRAASSNFAQISSQEPFSHVSFSTFKTLTGLFSEAKSACWVRSTRLTKFRLMAYSTPNLTRTSLCVR